MRTTTPRCFIVRHGETEWSLSGKHTGTTELPLTRNGEKRMSATGHALIGDDRLIVPAQLVHIYVSPRKRAQRTLELLDIGCHDPLPWESTSTATQQKPARTNAKVSVTSDIAEWDYGAYEGITTGEIRARLDVAGMPTNWDIWRDGCLNGESPPQITERVDRLIAEIREKYHRPAFSQTNPAGDVIVVGHGHILRAFAIRWVGNPLTDTAFLMEAGGVGILSYEHHSIDEPRIMLGGGFAVVEDDEPNAKK